MNGAPVRLGRSGLAQGRLLGGGPNAAERGPGWFVAVANLDLRADFFAGCERGDGYPVQAVGAEVARVEFLVRADGDAVRVGMDGKDIARRGVTRLLIAASGNVSQPLALADREGVDAFVLADDLACGGDEFAGGVGHLFLLIVEVCAEEDGVIAAWDEAYLLRVGLLREGEAGIGSHRAHGGLLHLAEREERARELLLSQPEEEVGLVLGTVRGAGEDPAAARGIVVVAGVVARGDAVGTDLAGGEQQCVELEVVVAQGAGNRCAAGKVLVDEGAHDLRLEARFLIHQVVRDAKVLGDGAGVVYVVQRTATAADVLRHAFVAGEAALVPELEGESDDRVALGAKERG